MVSLPLLIALLTLIDVTRSFEYFIDLERCKIEKGLSELACYVRESCVDTPTPGDPKTLMKFSNEKLKDDTCDVIVQMKAFTENKYHIMMQVNVSASESPLDELDVNAGISIAQHETQIKCSSAGIEGKIVKGTFGSRQIYTNNYIFCSAILFNQGSTIPDVFGKIPYKPLRPSFEISLSNGKMKLEFPGQGKVFWNVPEKCNDESLATSNKETHEYLYSAIDIAPAILSCPAPQQIRVEYLDDQPIMSSSVECVGIQWAFMNKTNERQLVELGQGFFVYCAIKFSELCSQSPLGFINCTGCTPPNTTSIDTYECPYNKWRMSDGSVMDNSVKCKRKGNERTSTWQLSNGTEITEGACSREFDCPIFNNINFVHPEADNLHEFKSALRSDDGMRISCPEDFKLTVVSNGQTDYFSASLSCNPESGYYKLDDSKIDIRDRGATIYCSKNLELPPEKKQPATGALSTTMIGSCIGGVIVLLLIAGGVIFFVLKREKRKKLKKKKMKMMEPPSDGLYTAKEIDPDKEVLRENLKNEWYLDPIPADEIREYQKIKDDEYSADPYRYYEDGPVRSKDSEVLPRAGEFDHWSHYIFIKHIVGNFHRYTTANRLTCLRALTAFLSVSDSPRFDAKQKEKNKEFGILDQFHLLIRTCHVHKLKCHETWDTLFRLSRYLVDRASTTNLHMCPVRYRVLWQTVAKDMVTDLGYFRNTKNETAQKKNIRILAIRIMLWAEDYDVTKQIAEFAKLPIDDINDDILPIVLFYAVRDGGREEEVKKLFYEEVGRQNYDTYLGAPIGMYRHHLIYALCAARDKPNVETGKSGGYATMKEILGVLYADERKCFTFTDLLYAYKGATENVDSWPTAVDQFASFAGNRKDIEAWVDKTVRQTHGGLDERDKMFARIKSEVIRMMTIVAECCTTDEQFQQVKNAWPLLVKYAVTDADLPYFNEQLMADRVHNLDIMTRSVLYDYNLAISVKKHTFHMEIYDERLGKTLPAPVTTPAPKPPQPTPQGDPKSEEKSNGKKEESLPSTAPAPKGDPKSEKLGSKKEKNTPPLAPAPQPIPQGDPKPEKLGSKKEKNTPPPATAPQGDPKSDNSPQPLK